MVKSAEISRNNHPDNWGLPEDPGIAEQFPGKMRHRTRVSSFLPLAWFESEPRCRHARQSPGSHGLSGSISSFSTPLCITATLHSRPLPRRITIFCPDVHHWSTHLESNKVTSEISEAMCHTPSVEQRGWNMMEPLQFADMKVSINGGTPKSSILIGFCTRL